MRFRPPAPYGTDGGGGGTDDGGDGLGAGAVTSRMARGAALMLAGRLAAGVLQFASFAVIASHLGPSGLGVYSLALAFVSVFTVLPSFGFHAVVVRDIAQDPDVERALIPNLAYLRLCLGGVAYALLIATLVIGRYGGLNSRATLVANTLLFLLAANSFALVLHVRLRQGLLATLDASKDALLVAGTIALARAGAGVIAFLWLYVAVNALNALASGVAALRVTRFEWRPRPRLMGSLLASAAPLALSGLFTALYFRVDMAILAGLKPSADVGIYGAAYRFLDMFIVLPVIVMSVVAPVLARSVSEGHEILRARYRRIVHLLVLVAVPVAVAGAMTGARALPAVPGLAEFGRAGAALAILSLAAALLLLNTFVQGTLVAAHLTGRLLRISATGLAVTVVANLLLIPPLSFVGAAVATVVTEVFSLACSVIAVRRRLGLRWPMERLPRVALAGAVLALVLVAGYALHPFAQLALGAVAYLIALVPTGALRWEDLRGVAPGDGSAAVVCVGGTHEVRSAATGVAIDLARLGPVRLWLPRPPPAGTEPAGVEVAGGGGRRLRDVWRASRRSASCHLVVEAQDRLLWAPLGARLAGCHPVRVILAASPGDSQDASARLWWARRRLWPLLLDSVVVTSPGDLDDLARRLGSTVILGPEGWTSAAPPGA